MLADVYATSSNNFVSSIIHLFYASYTMTEAKSNYLLVLYNFVSNLVCFHFIHCVFVNKTVVAGCCSI